MSENLKAVMTEEVEAQVRQEISTLVSNAQALVITNEMENTEALKLIATYKSEIKRRQAMDAYVKTVESKRAATAALKALTELMIDPLSDSVAIMTEKAGTFTKQENARRAELQRIEDEKAAAAQAKEDARVAAIQAKEEARVREAQRKLDEAHAAKVKAEQEAAAKAGREAAAIAPPPVIEVRTVAVPRFVAPARTVAAVSAPAGTSLPKRWSAKVVNKMLFLRAVLAGEEPEYSVEIVMPPYNAKATACKVDGKEIAPGIIAESKIGTMSR